MTKYLSTCDMLEIAVIELESTMIEGMDHLMSQCTLHASSGGNMIFTYRYSQIRMKSSVSPLWTWRTVYRG